MSGCFGGLSLLGVLQQWHRSSANWRRVKFPTATIPAHRPYNYFLAGDTRRELDVTIADTEVVCAPYINEIYMLMSNSKTKEENFRSNFPMVDVQDFLAGYKNSMKNDDYLKNYATEERKKPSIIDHIEYSIVSVLNKDGFRYRGGAGGGGGSQAALRESIKTFIFLLENWDVLSRDRVRKFGTPILKDIKGSNRTKTNQSTKSNLSVDKI